MTNNQRAMKRIGFIFSNHGANAAFDLSGRDLKPKCQRRFTRALAQGHSLSRWYHQKVPKISLTAERVDLVVDVACQALGVSDAT